jgi:hypothetical protein
MIHPPHRVRQRSQCSDCSGGVFLWASFSPRTRARKPARPLVFGSARSDRDTAEIMLCEAARPRLPRGHARARDGCDTGLSLKVDGSRRCIE